MESIELKNISKKYGSFTALDQINLKLEKGKIYGLLGRNGAGKSTLLRIITNRIYKNSGKILFDGNPYITANQFSDIFLVEQDNLFHIGLNAKELFKNTNEFFPKFTIDQALVDASEFGLNLKKKYKDLSTGYQSILRAIIALNTHADFMFLDEPTLGHDVVSRDLFYRKVLREYTINQNTIILSTHLIDEVSPLIEEAIFLKNGKLQLKKNSEELLNGYTKLVGPKERLIKTSDKLAILKKTDKGSFSELIIDNAKSSLEDLDDSIKTIKPELQELFLVFNEGVNWYEKTNSIYKILI